MATVTFKAINDTTLFDLRLIVKAGKITDPNKAGVPPRKLPGRPPTDQPAGENKRASSTQRTSQAVPHPSTDRALQRLASEFGRDPAYSLRYGRLRTLCCHLRGAPRPSHKRAKKKGHRPKAMPNTIIQPNTTKPGKNKSKKHRKSLSRS
jgi:hypothetical protein